MKSTALTPAIPRTFFSKPWTLFLVFLLVNALLAWMPLTVWQRLWFFPLGLILQVALALGTPSPPASGEPLFRKEFFKLSSPWPWIGLVFLAVFMRFYRLESLPLWPCWDEAYYSYFAVGLQEKWNWQLFWTSQKITPLFFWLQGLFYKILGPSLFSLWLFPALLSLLGLPIAYAAARNYFSRSFSFLFLFLLALGFYSIYYGRFCMSAILVLAWEFLLLFLLGFFLRSKTSEAALRRSLLLGLGAAVGLYLSTLLCLPISLMTLLVGRACLQKPRWGWKVLVVFSTAAFLPSLPVEISFLENLLGGHLFTHLVFSHQPSSFAHQTVTSLSYFTVFFFGSIDQSYWAFGPLWGGFLNPLGGAFFFLGLREFNRLRAQPFFSWGLGALLFPLLPVFLFTTVEFVRIFLILPALFFFIALGLASLFAAPAFRFKGVWLGLLLALFGGLDGFHLFGSFQRWSAQMVPGLAVKSPERWKAFGILEKISREWGPGLVFTDFVQDIYDQSLLTATYPFNAGRNPRLNPSQARWAALLVDLHYQEAILRRFPKSQVSLLSDELPASSPDKNPEVLALVVIPLDRPEQGRLFEKWLKVHRSLQDLYAEMPYHVENPNFDPVIRRLIAFVPACERDSLLEAWVEEKILNLLLVNPDVTDALWFLGRPAADPRDFPFFNWKFAMMYHRLGMGLVQSGRLTEARESFRRASRFDPKYELKKWLALCGGVK